MGLKVLMVAPEPFYSPRGTPLSVYYRALVASALGAEIDLLTYGQGRDVDIPSLRIIRIPRFRFLDPIGPGPSYKKLFLDCFLILWATGLLLRRRYHVVHAHEESIFFCGALKPLFRFKLVYDMHSSLPQQLRNYRFTRSKSVIELFRAMERYSLRVADAVLTISPVLAEYALERMPDPARHFLIENTMLEEVRLKNQRDALARPTETISPPAGRRVVAYAGTFDAYQGVDLLVRAFPKVRERRPEAFLLLSGGLPRQIEDMRRLAADRGLEGHCLFTGQVSRATASALTRGAAVVVSLRREGINTPLKVYELLAGGVPLVATRVPAHTQILNDEVCFLADPDPDSLAEAILAALSEDGQSARVARKAAALYRARYSRAAYEDKMRALLRVLA